MMNLSKEELLKVKAAVEKRQDRAPVGSREWCAAQRDLAEVLAAISAK
jgi:hypothetical protein